MIQEENDFRRIDGYPNYLVNKYGEVFSLLSHKIISSTTNKKGYETVRLRYGYNGKNLFVHRLVATAFVANPYRKPEVHHLDKNPSNNYYKNLIWVTKKEHQDYHKKED